MKKQFFKFILSFAAIYSFTIALNYVYPNHLNYVDDNFLDVLFNTKEDRNVDSNVVIIDIDEKSLNDIGQWPWSRNILAQLINNLNEFHPSCIGLGIIFSEKDRTSPSNLTNTLSSNTLDNYDQIFAQTIENSSVPIVLGYSFLSTEIKGEYHTTPYIPAVIKNKIEDNKIGFYESSNILLNIPVIQDSAYSSGFLNSIPNENGRIVSMPLVMSYKNQLFPSLALEVIRTIYSARELNIAYDKDFGNYLEFATLKIPLDESASRKVNYIKTKKGFQHISAVDIIKKDFSKFFISDIQSKIILVGSSAVGLSQFTSTPFTYNLPTIDLQANVIENILNNKSIIEPIWEYKFQLIATAVIILLVLISIFFRSVTVNITTFLVSLIVIYVTLKYFFDLGYILSIAYLLEASILSLIVGIIIHIWQNKSDISNIKGKFASKVSKAVMDDLLETTNKKGDLSSKRKTVTIFFSDIKSFTGITEKINDPNTLTRYINRYMDAMTKNIMHSEGTVDKFMGDAIMAYWNAPNDVNNHADKALTSAIEQIDLLKEINSINEDEGMPLISIRIGLNYGEAFVGEVGGEFRSDYTIMGKNVNHTAVLEQVGKFYHADIIMSQSVKENLKDKYVYMLIDLIQVDGTSDAFNIYQVFYKGEADEFILEEIELFEKGVVLYRQAQFDDAILIFRTLLLRDNILNKKLCEIYIQRCEINSFSSSNIEFDPVQSINKSVISNGQK